MVLFKRSFSNKNYDLERQKLCWKQLSRSEKVDSSLWKNRLWCFDLEFCMRVFPAYFFNTCGLTSNPANQAAFVDLEQQNTNIFYISGKD